MSRLLSTPGEGPWWIASVRPGGRPRKAELDAAARLTQAAALLEIPLRRVLLLTPNEAWDLAEIPR